jgi:putative (di)nucleoside polyphosphate hydrolase
MRFTGGESEIDVVTPRIDDEPEFDTWRWEKLERLPELVVPFKQHVYHAVVREFSPFAKVLGP